MADIGHIFVLFRMPFSLRKRLIFATIFGYAYCNDWSKRLAGAVWRR